MLDVSTALQNEISSSLPVESGLFQQISGIKLDANRLSSIPLGFNPKNERNFVAEPLSKTEIEDLAVIISPRWIKAKSAETKSSQTRPSKLRQATRQQEQFRDPLTGMEQAESLTKANPFNQGEQQRLVSPALSKSSQSSKSKSRARGGRRLFNPFSGYGLVDAAESVAKSINMSNFSNVADLGGVNWAVDLVRAPEVWTKGYTGQGVTVAVIDSGVDITHPDLQSNIWVNGDEIAGDGIDNDANGYIDDINGWNFGIGQNNNNVMPGTSDPGQNHGTHVAGTIAAKNDGLGMTGVAPNAKIMALRLGDVSGTNIVNSGSLATAIYYAVNNGAKVINMSLGFSSSPELQSALAYAAANNVITISASGNEGSFTPNAPARYATQYGLSVGAVNRSRVVPFFSNGSGSNRRLQHVVAPGVQVYSTLPGGSYGLNQGTSMATPHVAGVAALMFSANPNLTANQVRQLITSSADAVRIA
jgi:subtilisin family serine protease